MKKLFTGKVIMLVGPRQVGKTTLIRKILKETDRSFEFFDGDDPTVRRLLDTPNTEQLRQIIGEAKIIFIDEAHRISNIGLTSKIIADQFGEKQLILSGSSSFDLSGNIQEPLTGRKWTFNLFPVSWAEFQDYRGYLKAEQELQIRMIYGFYPDVLNHPDEQQETLTELVESYLYKDVLTYAGIRKPEVIQKLVQAISYEVGQEVGYKELGDTVGLDPKTVSNYIDILEKAFVLYRLPAFSRNLRNEIKKKRKIYFYDNGVRNAVISNFQPLVGREDTDALWENYLITERIKQIRYRKQNAQSYFWRTKQMQEIDYVENLNGKVSGFEFKWNPKRSSRIPKTFTEAYKAEVKGVDRNNFREFVTP